MPIGQKIIRLDAVDSTNNYAASMLQQGIVGHGAVILAEEQISGRGQRGSEWHSLPGMNLLVSICLRPANLSVDQQFLLTQFVSVSMVELLKGFSIEARIKWPNDIYVDQKKIAGILIENSLKGDCIQSSVVGIGLNVNQMEFNGLNATSMRLLKEQQFNLTDVLMSLLNNLNSFYDIFQRHEYFLIENQYEDLLFQKDKLCLYEDASGKFNGLLKGVTSSGQLVLQVDQQLKTYSLKEIGFIL